MLPPQSPKQNRVLAALALPNYTRLLPLLDRVSLLAGDVVYEPGRPIRYLYFPTSCILAHLYQMENGACTQTGIIGSEGLTGIFALFGDQTSPGRVVVQSTGDAYRVKTALVTSEFEGKAELRNLILRFTHALMVQTEQLAVSNRYYTVDEQLSYFLLMSLDRSPDNEVHVTHEQVGIMLGVRRESVTVAAQKLQLAGAIHCRRGHLTVVDRQQLETRAGENYKVVKREYEHLLEFYASFGSQLSEAETGAHRRDVCDKGKAAAFESGRASRRV
jgi:CRP-like cAMP-binding protein